MKKQLFLLILAVFIAQSASAYTFLNLYVEENGAITFLGETDENLSLPNGVDINNGEIIGQTQQLTGKSADVWSLSYILRGAEINVILPEGAVIKQISNGEISIQRNQIHIYFKDSVSVSYAIESVPNSHIKNIVLMIIVSLAVIIAIIYFIKYARKQNSKNKIRTKKPDTKKQKQQIIQQLLNDREKTILSKLKETGKIKQSQLRKLVQIPKASFSRHLQELEKKNLIKRSGEGKNKFVEFTK